MEKHIGSLFGLCLTEVLFHFKLIDYLLFGGKKSIKNRG